jgi:hypothetical protein
MCHVLFFTRFSAISDEASIGPIYNEQYRSFMQVFFDIVSNCIFFHSIKASAVESVERRSCNPTASSLKLIRSKNLLIIGR